MVEALLPWWIRWYVAPRVAYPVADPDEARAAVDELAASGVDFLKVIVDRIPGTAPRIGSDALRAAVDQAKRRNLRAVAHIGTLADARDAAQAGVAAWLHGVYAETLDDAGVRELAGFGIPMAPTSRSSRATRARPTSASRPRSSGDPAGGPALVEGDPCARSPRLAQPRGDPGGQRLERTRSAGAASTRRTSACPGLAARGPTRVGLSACPRSRALPPRCSRPCSSARRRRPASCCSGTSPPSS
jgi:hypothetical protein